MELGGPDADLARQVAFDAEVPVVESPLSGHSLASLAGAGVSLTASLPAEASDRQVVYVK